MPLGLGRSRDREDARVGEEPFVFIKQTLFDGAQLSLASGSHHVRDTNARSLRAVRLAGGGLADSRCQRFAQGQFKPDDGGEGCTNHDDPDSHEVSGRGICFYASNLVLHPLRALIERICLFIDGSDERQRVARYRAAAGRK